jgi:hypothetical protein
LDAYSLASWHLSQPPLTSLPIRSYYRICKWKFSSIYLLCGLGTLICKK